MTVSEEIEALVQSQVKAWQAEIDRLLHDPQIWRIRRFRKQSEESGPSLEESTAASWGQSYPFDPYEALEFARGLAGRTVSAIELSKLMRGHFADMSRESRQMMIHFLMENEVAEVARKTAGRVTWYRFGPPTDGGIFGRGKGFGTPGRSLSRLKREDLEEVVVRDVTTSHPP